MSIDFHMDQRLSMSVASAWARLWGAVKSAWSATRVDGAGKYRPEAHYMRGPGPKWRAKHDLSASGFGPTGAG
jgi:hypothetical protein